MPGAIHDHPERLRRGNRAWELWGESPEAEDGGRPSDRVGDMAAGARHWTHPPFQPFSVHRAILLMSKLYDAANFWENKHIFKELILWENDDVASSIRSVRPDYWAVCALRVSSIPAVLEEAGDNGVMLVTILLARGTPRPMRYDRVIILGGPDDLLFDTTIQFIRYWVPEYWEQRRIFSLRLERDADRDHIFDTLSSLRVAE